MSDFLTSMRFPIISTEIQSAPSSSSVPADDFAEDGCSICLEPFTTHDPATITSCRHEFHLQCILEWSQRSKECPNCWQSLALNDPRSQELLAAAAIKRSLRPRRLAANSSTSSPQYNEYDLDYEASYADGSDFNEHMMQHLAAAMGGAYYYAQQRERERSYEPGSSQGFMFSPGVVQQLHPNSPEDWYSAYVPSEGSSPTSSISSMIGKQEQLISSPIASVGNLFPAIGLQRDNHHGSRTTQRRALPNGTQTPRLSDPHPFSESIKSRWSAASARYKDSITKRTQGLKEKLIARNNTMKELSKGIQREMNTSIAGLGKLIERLDLKSKRNMNSGQGCSPAKRTSDVFNMGERGAGEYSGED